MLGFELESLPRSFLTRVSCVCVCLRVFAYGWWCMVRGVTRARAGAGCHADHSGHSDQANCSAHSAANNTTHSFEALHVPLGTRSRTHAHTHTHTHTHTQSTLSVVLHWSCSPSCLRLLAHIFILTHQLSLSPSLPPHHLPLPLSAPPYRPLSLPPRVRSPSLIPRPLSPLAPLPHTPAFSLPPPLARTRVRTRCTPLQEPNWN